MPNLLVSRAQFQARIDSGGNFNSAENTAHDSILEAVSRAVELHCNRTFYSLAATTRVFTAEWPDLLVVPDLVSVTTLATDEDGDQTCERTWGAADYELYPWNASDTGWPYTEVHVSTATGSAGYTFPTGQKGVSITGTWGWSAVPLPVYEAVMLESLRLNEQQSSPSGVIQNNAGGMEIIPGLHPSTVRMLAPYVRRVRIGAARAGWRR